MLLASLYDAYGQLSSTRSFWCPPPHRLQNTLLYLSVVVVGPVVTRFVGVGAAGVAAFRLMLDPLLVAGFAVGLFIAAHASAPF